jgi:hypothetical protein
MNASNSPCCNLPHPKNLLLSHGSVLYQVGPLGSEGFGTGVTTEVAERFSGMDILTRRGLSRYGGGVSTPFVSFHFYCSAVESNKLCAGARTICNRRRPLWERDLNLTLTSLIQLI